ncbi:hypothetical protein LC607_33495 [Nostoc sp. CHAB 5824]|nr:hypothetical protein [Nostoc sp. CHAB 5824]
MYIAECPEVGTVDQGETIEQSIASLREATQLYLEEFPLPKTSLRYRFNKILAMEAHLAQNEPVYYAHRLEA